MQVTATDARNCLGQMLEDCQREPVIIEEAGHRHGVLLSASQYDALVAASAAAVPSAGTLPSPRNADEFYARYKDWVDEQNRLFDQYGIWNEDVRTW